MSNKCFLCGKEIGKTFLEKLKGTSVKINQNGKNKIYHVCSDCQKKFGDKVKEELSKH